MVYFKFNIYFVNKIILFCLRYGWHLSVNSYFICNDSLVIKKIFESIRQNNNQPNNVTINYLPLIMC